MKRAHSIKELKIELNRNCPLHCLHCSSNGLPHASDSLEFNRVSELIREFSLQGGIKLCISGGEPLTYKELPVVIDACTTNNIQVSIYTTGIVSSDGIPKIITDDTIDLLVKSDVRMVFSLHGACAETHDAMTGVGGSFKATVNAIQKIRKTGLPTEAHIVPTAMNFNELVPMSEILASLNIRKVSWLRLVPQGRACSHWDVLHLRREQISQLTKIKNEIESRYPMISLRTGAPFNILCPEVPTSCEAGVSVLTIRPDGFVAPCDAFKGFDVHDEFSNILNHSLIEVWNKSFFLNSIRKIQEPKLISSCAKCTLYSHCNSGCLAQQIIAMDNMCQDRDPDCPRANEKLGAYEIEGILIR